MDEPLQRLARPKSEEGPDPTTARGVSRSHLTLYLSLTALVLSIASAGVNLFVFLAAGQRKTVNEADQIQLQASANRVLQELTSDPKSHPQLATELNKLYKSLVYRPPFDASLNVYERAAFGMVVENYAKPMAEVQLHSVDARVKLMGLAFKANGHYLNYGEIGCVIDPFGFDCGGLPGFDTEKPPQEKK